MNNFLSYFQNIIKNKWIPNRKVLELGEQLVNYSQKNNYPISNSFEEVTYEAINQKLKTGHEFFQKILDVAFQQNISLNYNLKKEIRNFINKGDKEGYIHFLHEQEIFNVDLENAFQCLSYAETKDMFLDFINDNKKIEQILTSVFVRAFYNLFEPKCRDLFFSNEDTWSKNYSELLDKKYSNYIKRNCSLCFIQVNKLVFKNGYEEGCNFYCNYLKEYYKKLDNYSDIVITIPPMGMIDDNDVQWELFADLILFAEKHYYHKLDRKYFRKQEIIDRTKNYIPDLNLEKANLDEVADGFVFKDCYVVKNKNSAGYVLTLVLEKNFRDERKINCPACQSNDVRGNSYSILNVKSWECNNPLCPDRSIYNRGKRYSYVSYMRQKQMENPKNEIPSKLLKQWRRDVVEINDYEEIFKMACLFYSFVGDTIDVLSDTIETNRIYLGRKINNANIGKIQSKIYTNFINSCYFDRYNYDNRSHISSESSEKIRLSSKTVLIKGDSREVLKKYSDNYFDGVVTSPPYYNAKKYSHWENIYCYLYDMRNIGKEVYRTLKSNGVFLYNIFDYFDNERNVTFSAMGNKRMILGAYTIDLFRRIGFKISGNIIWDKGQVQGNRHFNQGNNMPYYQAPLNCWEHVLVFTKGKKAPKFKQLYSKIEKISPVIKYIKGKNIVGHEAPYPDKIPDLILNCLNKEDVVLDPFSGSFTTGIAANKKDINSVSIEISEKYVELSKRRFDESIKQN